jgi:hypothetical protein
MRREGHGEQRLQDPESNVHGTSLVSWVIVIGFTLHVE